MRLSQNTPLISIVTPVLNDEKSIRQTIQSVIVGLNPKKIKKCKIFRHSFKSFFPPNFNFAIKYSWLKHLASSNNYFLVSDFLTLLFFS